MNKLYILNHKMNLTKDNIDTYIKKINKLSTTNHIIICPSSIYLNDFKLNTNYDISSQNIHYMDEGSYTGEISAKQLNSLNIKYTLVGHFERRILFNETEEIINKKISSCIRNNIIPILCIGEYEELDTYNKTISVLSSQLNNALKNNNIKEIIIAYEPAWSIGTGKIPNKDILNKIIKYIYDYLNDNYHIKFNIVYGGSVTKENINDIISISNIDGVLLGPISLDIDSLKIIINN